MKPAAQLTSNLLARKGAAAPVDISSANASAAKAPAGSWNNVASARPAKKSAAPPTVNPIPTALPDHAKPHEDHSDRVAMTLRLDPQQHRRLRLVSVHSHLSAREIMTAALDIYLDHLQEKFDIAPCACLKPSK